MRIISRTITMTLSTGLFATLFVSNAFAGCGDLNLNAPFEFAKTSEYSSLVPKSDEPSPSSRGGTSASIVGLWKFQLISKGNTGHNPSIPDGALLDYGYRQWHSDGTEIQNSAGVPGGGFCLGVWGQTGFLTFELNHFPVAFTASSPSPANYINLREQDTLSPSGDSYTGTFTENIYDTKGNQVDHLAGTVTATRITVDSSFPSALPTS
jgi:hypothetical protein